MTPEKEKALKDEAKTVYPLYDGQTYQEMRDATIGQKAYIAGATSEAEKNESNAASFAEYCSLEGWHFRKAIGNWNCLYKDENLTTAELYSLYINSK